MYWIVPSVSFSPRTNEYGRMSDRIFPMIAEVGLYEYIYMVATDLFPSHNIQTNICAIQWVINGYDDVALKVNEEKICSKDVMTSSLTSRKGQKSGR